MEMDEYCPAISKTFPGFKYAARLGDSNRGAEMEAIEYTLSIDSSNSLLLVHFAWVMEHCNHDVSEQPQFSMTLKDTSGNVLNIPDNGSQVNPNNWMYHYTCNEENIVANNWVTVGFDLRYFIGQTIKIYYETRDCAQGDHFAYAYIVNECRPMKIETQLCEGETAVRLRAPEGFVWYKWTRSSQPDWLYEGLGKNYRNIVCPDALEGEIFTCQIRSELGFLLTLQTTVVRTDIDAFFMFCVKNDGIVIFPPGQGNQSWYDTCNRTATFVDLSTVTGSAKQSVLWEIPALKAVSSDSLFTCTFPNPDTATTYNVRLTVFAENGCTDTTSQSITIYPVPEVKIISSKTFFTEGKDTLTALFKGRFLSYVWSWILSEDATTGTDNISNPLIVEKTGTYRIDALEEEGCLLSDVTGISDLKTFFRYGVMQSGIIDFTGHNNENHYDSCTRTATFVDSSSLYNTEICTRFWQIDKMNISSSDPLFRVTFPDEEEPQTYIVRLQITTTNNDYDVYEDSITIFPVSKIDIDFTRTMHITGTDTLKAVSLRGDFVSYQWTWRAKFGDVRTDTGSILLLSERWIYCILQAEDEKGCYARDTIFNDAVSISEHTQETWTLGQNIPNPARNTVSIPYSIPVQGQVTFEVYAVTGQLLYKETITSSAGSHKITYDVSALSSGIYFYTLRYNKGILSRKMIVN
jgi:hypothetical protein